MLKLLRLTALGLTALLLVTCSTLYWRDRFRPAVQDAHLPYRLPEVVYVNGSECHLPMRFVVNNGARYTEKGVMATTGTVDYACMGSTTVRIELNAPPKGFHFN